MNELRERARPGAGGKQRSTLLVPPGLVREIDPYSVGVQRSELASAHASGAPYVSREIDALLQKRIKDCWRVCETPLVVVSGPHTSGKSRTLWEALRRVVPNATVYAVRPPRQSAGFDAAARPVTELLEEHRPRGRHGTVIWIDDAHDHFNHGLDVEALRKLCAFGKIRRRRSHPLVVAVTLDARRLADTEEFDPLLAQELRAASTGTELRSTLNRPVELDEAKSLYPYIATHPMLERLPELFAAADLLRDRYHSSRSSRPEGIAVARAAITWRVAGMPPGIDHFGLHELAAVLLRQEHPDAELDGERFASALSWATRRVAGDASLVRRIRDSDQWRYVAANALVALWEDEGETVPAAAWEIVLSRATSRTGFGVGCAAYSAGELEIAERAFAIAAEAPGSDGAHAWFGLGVVRTRDGDLAGAAAAYEHTINRGTPVQAARAGLNVSLLRGEPSATEDASQEDASPEAVETDSREAAAEAAIALGALREPDAIEEEVSTPEQEFETDSAEEAAEAAVELDRTRPKEGDIDAAVAAYQAAIDSGTPEPAARAAFGVGLLRQEPGDIENETEASHEEVESDSPEVAADTAVALDAVPEPDDIEAEVGASEHEVESDTAEGAAHAAVELGRTRQEQGDIDGAVAAYEAAIDSGIPEPAARAGFSVGLLREKQGDVEGAAAAYESAISIGDAEQTSKAAFNLGLLRYDKGDVDGAAAAYQQAIDSGIPKQAAKAAVNLGLLRYDQGDFDAAAAALQQAIDIGIPKQAAQARINLGLLRHEQGDLEGAAAALQRAIDCGIPEEAANAALNLGLLRHEQGDFEGAVAAYQRAIDSGIPDEAAEAALNLAALQAEQPQQP